MEFDTGKAGARHICSKKVWQIDEDSYLTSDSMSGKGVR